MDKLTFTLSDLLAVILGFCGGVITISSASNVLGGWINRAKAPEVKQDERLTKLEKRIDNLESSTSIDSERLKKIEESNRITQRGMLALLKHSINGEDIETLKRAEKDLEEHLITKD
jgi:uncharacterized protein YdeI (YjbR/CyaY-like superfamily)